MHSDVGIYVILKIARNARIFFAM